MWNPFNKNKAEPDKPSPKKARKKTAKEVATEAGEPYVNVVTLEIAEDNIDEGAFELDWNDKFIANLVRAGYQQQPNEPDHDIVDRWFQNVCRHVVMETYEQAEANYPDLTRPTQEKDIGGGRKEVS